MSANIHTIDTEYYKKMKLIHDTTFRVAEYLRLGIENMFVEVHVSDMHFSTIKVTTNPLKLRMGAVTEETVKAVLESIEYILWRTLNVNKKYFVLQFSIKNGALEKDSIDCRFTEQDTKERRSNIELDRHPVSGHPVGYQSLHRSEKTHHTQ